MAEERVSYPKYTSDIPYTSLGARLQTLDLWLPRPLENSDAATSVFIVYVHGGAWRDPTQDATTCIQPTFKHLIPTSPSVDHIAGIASLNYRLSPYRNHQTDPSKDSDTSRNARHPDHVTDVRLALQYLAEKHGVGRKFRWIGIGHSCGATLLAQYVSGLQISDDDGGLGPAGSPSSLVLLAGIYDIPKLLSNHTPPTCPENISQIYRDFIEGAFGKEVTEGEDGGEKRGMYEVVSPASRRYVEKMCPKLKNVVLAWSPEDELIEEEQRVLMLERLRKEGWVEQGQTGDRVVHVKDLRDGHDDVWQDGGQVAELIGEAVQSMFENS